MINIGEGILGGLVIAGLALYVYLKLSHKEWNDIWLEIKGWMK
jgi:hypothetical protein